jgi:hypothetical protein
MAVNLVTGICRAVLCFPVICHDIYRGLQYVLLDRARPSNFASFYYRPLQFYASDNFPFSSFFTRNDITLWLCVHLM